MLYRKIERYLLWLALIIIGSHSWGTYQYVQGHSELHAVLTRSIARLERMISVDQAITLNYISDLNAARGKHGDAAERLKDISLRLRALEKQEYERVCK